ncbi:MAG TPA: hypothetical protein VIT44_06345 [Cyclobacteriaceae bacterium]
MKDEGKIIELLSDYLKKTDQLLERMDNSDKKMQLAYDILIKHSEEILSLRKETLKREVQHDTLLKEIFSISKRVGNLEDGK